MTYDQAKTICHVRSSIYRMAHPSKKFPKNHSVSFDERVPNEWKGETDWQEYDPRESAYEALA
ncbi:hypothetical protein KL867_17595 [Ruegeria litorea]|uniref:Transposase n=1 Tax=Falsiruegeria litorea TaxID=1280831 RepID=A0ABS5WUZ4_9RHOB|nr:hypothetical protein [Falsiruegeria litorea]MBT3142886.1 hypothetical protein [Falsiruegeria litorea]